ncbi:CHAT domain-containing protein [Rhodocollybia butyracea]|uniref:CHAT domain-containing protein n=1 Tax=Rhodocollybia butyracea TaxID=206335 RepID=A0A9P5PT08_9AGAR|nr:CHAT domain-containing protein [Rhodocollybia butyracea]
MADTIAQDPETTSESRAVRLALRLSTLPSDMFDKVLISLASYSWDVWDDDNFDPQIAARDLSSRISRMSPQDKLETSALHMQEFIKTGDIEALNPAIGLLKNASNGFSEMGDSEGVCNALRQLAGCLTLRFEHTRDSDDLNAAIQACKEALDLDNSAERSNGLFTIGRLLSQRFTRSMNQDDLVQSLESFIGGLSILPEEEKRNALAFVQNDIAKSMKMAWDSIHHKPIFLTFRMAFMNGTNPSTSSTIRAQILKVLGSTLLYQFQEHGKTEDLDEAVVTLKGSTELDSTVIEAMNTYGACCLIRFEQRGLPDDLEVAVATQRKSVQLLDARDERYPSVLNGLGNALQSRFELLGKAADLDEALTTHYNALHHIKLKKEDKFIYHCSLGTAYHRRFEHFQHLSDLELAVNQLKMAISGTPEGHRSEALILATYGSALLRLYGISHRESALEKSIKVLRKAVSLTALDNPARPPRLHNLAQAILFSSSEVQGIEEAIGFIEEAISRWHSGPTSMLMFCLSTALKRKYQIIKLKVSQEVAGKDLDRSIQLGRRAIQGLLIGHDLPKLCFELAQSLLLRYKDIGTVPSDRNEALSVLEEGSKHSSKPVVEQFICALGHAQLRAEVDGIQAGLAAFKYVFKLIPDVVWIGNSIDQRYGDTKYIHMFLSDAVGLAIKAGDLKLALEWAEKGRCIIWGQIQQFRQPVSDGPWAEELKLVTTQLQSMDSHQQMSDPTLVIQVMSALALTVIPDDEPDGMSREEYAQQLAAFAFGQIRSTQYPKLTNSSLQKISRPCLLLLEAVPLSSSMSATSGVMQAIVPWQTEPVGISLEAFSEIEAKEMVSTFISDLEARKVRTRCRGFSQSTFTGRLRSILAILWKNVVHPILMAFGDKLHRLDDGRLPHITWCPSGPLTFLPLHAAGMYKSTGGESIFDYAVSSYTPSITALLSAQEHHSTSESQESNSVPRLLAVSQPNTPNAEELPSTVKEVEVLQSIEPNLTWLNDLEGTTDAVLKGIETHNWVHFACHGEQDMQNPLKSAFLLQDKSLELADLMKKSFTHTQLAYLSACRTAASNEMLPEEAVHLAAGMLMAGFQNVVASLWAIGDDDATFVAEHFYRHMKEGGWDSAKSSYALHYAVGKLRESIGVKHFLRWIPFVHLGL